VYILIVTDGSMGYCTLEEMGTISYIRHKETLECYQSLGIPKENIIWAGFPDCQLNAYRGRRHAKNEDRCAIENFAGLQNAFTYHLRQIRPTQCFLPTSNDLHPDHRIVYDEFLISLFHAGGQIWPELGDPLAWVPYVHEFGVYCDFPLSPQLQLRAAESHLDKKLEAIAAFRSQKQIGSLIDIVRKSGPEEYMRAVEFRLYQPNRYRNMFEKKDEITFIR
jgi:LmbE family N-acetylglucosaminyl deacetylase